jgi:general secretion pathway protein C
LFARIGFANGDTIQKVNGMTLESADKALDVYTKLRDATKLDIDVVRRGKPLTISLTIVK